MAWKSGEPYAADCWAPRAAKRKGKTYPRDVAEMRLAARAEPWWVRTSNLSATAMAAAGDWLKSQPGHLGSFRRTGRDARWNLLTGAAVAATVTGVLHD